MKPGCSVGVWMGIAVSVGTWTAVEGTTLGIFGPRTSVDGAVAGAQERSQSSVNKLQTNRRRDRVTSIEALYVTAKICFGHPTEDL
jgi:hypothetical protein